MNVINIAKLLYDSVRQSELDDNLKHLLQNKVQNLLSSLLFHNISVDSKEYFDLVRKLLECTDVERAEILIIFCELINENILPYAYADNNFLAKKIDFLNNKSKELKNLNMMRTLQEQIHLLCKVISLRNEANSLEFNQATSTINQQLTKEGSLFSLDMETLRQTVTTAEVMQEKAMLEKKLNKLISGSNQQKIPLEENFAKDFTNRFNSPNFAYAIALFALYENEKEQKRLQDQPDKLAVLETKYADIQSATQSILRLDWDNNTSRIAHLKTALKLNEQQKQILAKHTFWLKKVLHAITTLFRFMSASSAKSSLAQPAKPSFFTTQTTNKYQHLLSHVEQLEEVSQITKIQI